MDVVLQCLFYLNIFLWKAILNTLEMQQTVFIYFCRRRFTSSRYMRKNTVI